MLEAEWEFYKNNRNELVEKYCGKYVVISGNKVVSAYDDENEAYFETVKTIPLGSFMIHHVMEEEEVYQLFPSFEEEVPSPELAKKLAQLAYINGNLEKLNETEPLPLEFDNILARRVNFTRVLNCF